MRSVDAAVLESMNARGWRIYGLLRFSPLFDALLAAGADGAPAALRSAFEPVERDCARLGLSKPSL